jgi:hypothetical protein
VVRCTCSPPTSGVFASIYLLGKGPSFSCTKRRLRARLVVNHEDGGLLHVQGVRTVKHTGIVQGVRVDEDPTANWKLSNRFCGVSLGWHANNMVCAPRVCGRLAVRLAGREDVEVRPTCMWALGASHTHVEAWEGVGIGGNYGNN